MSGNIAELLRQAVPAVGLASTAGNADQHAQVTTAEPTAGLQTVNGAEDLPARATDDPQAHPTDDPPMRATDDPPAHATDDTPTAPTTDETSTATEDAPTASATVSIERSATVQKEPSVQTEAMSSPVAPPAAETGGTN